jgi:hypothetical protein
LRVAAGEAGPAGSAVPAGQAGQAGDTPDQPWAPASTLLNVALGRITALVFATSGR